VKEKKNKFLRDKSETPPPPPPSYPPPPAPWETLTKGEIYILECYYNLKTRQTDQSMVSFSEFVQTAYYKTTHSPFQFNCTIQSGAGCF